MKSEPLWVSYFTSGYSDEAHGLMGSLDRLGLAFDVRCIPSKGSWLANTSYKPTFLMRMRETHPQRPLVWVDADARVVGDVSIFADLRCDVAAHYFRDYELASGTVFLGPTHESYELVRRWAWRCEHNPDMLDQRALQIEAEAMPGIALQRLPAAYCFIDGLSEGEAAIVHGQASRRLRGGSFCGA